MQGAEQPEADQERNKVIENESRRNEVTKVKGREENGQQFEE